MTLVRKGFKFSLHGSFKKACKAYGWDYKSLMKKGLPATVGKYRIEKMPVEKTIEQMTESDEQAATS